MKTSRISLLIFGAILSSACGPAEPLDQALFQDLEGKSDYHRDYVVKDPIFNRANVLSASGVYPEQKEDPKFSLYADYAKVNGKKTVIFQGTPHIITPAKNKIEIKIDGDGFRPGVYLWARRPQKNIEQWDDQQGWQPEKEGWQRVVATAVIDVIFEPEKELIKSFFGPELVFNTQTNEMTFSVDISGRGFISTLKPYKFDDSEPLEFALFVVPSQDGWHIAGNYDYTIQLSRE